MTLHSQREISAGLNAPADFSHYHIRRELIAKRDAAISRDRWEQIQLLINQLAEYQARPNPQLARFIERQTRIVTG